MIIVNTSPNKLIQIGYEGEDKVTILRFSYSEKWLENGEGIFTVRVLRNGENQAYNAQVIKDDRENFTIDMTVTDVELSKKGYGEMQLVYTGADFVKKSPVYKYYVSRSVDDTVDPPAQDVYTQIIESLSDLQTDVRQIDSDVAGLSELTTAKIGDLSELTTTAKTDLVSAINEVNEHGGASVTVDSELSTTSENPVQNKVVTSAVQGKADIQTVSALADAVQGLDEDVQGLQTSKADKSYVDTQLATKASTQTVSDLSDDVSDLQTAIQGKADTATVTALSGTVSNLSDSAQQYMEYTNSAITNLWGSKASKSYVDGELALKADTQTVTALSGTVTGLQTSKADKTYVDTQLAGKASTQTVSDLADDVSDLQTGLAGKVGDVQVNGSSIVSDGVANVPIASGSDLGVVKINAAGDNYFGVGVNGNGELFVTPANSARIKAGVADYKPITVYKQHESAFYGLAKAAGHDEKNSTLPVGQYTEEAKIAIQKMLGIYEAPWELIREDTFTNVEEADHIITTDANGDAFELTDLVILFETPKQAVRAVKGYYGHIWCYYGDGNSQYMSLECGAWGQNANESYHACGGMIENKGGLMVSTIFQSSTGGARTSVLRRLRTGFSFDPSMSFIPSSLTFTKINILAVTGTGHYVLYGKRKWT